MTGPTVTKVSGQMPHNFTSSNKSMNLEAYSVASSATRPMTDDQEIDDILRFSEPIECKNIGFEQKRWNNLPLRTSLFCGHNSAVQMSRRTSPTRSIDLRLDSEMKLCCCAARGDLHGMHALIENGVAVNASDYNGQTALHLAAQRGYLDIVEYLIERSADINHKDSSGRMPLSLAQSGNHVEVQKVLRFAGAEEGLESPDIIEAKRSNLAKFAIMEAFPRPIAMAVLEGRRVDQISKDNVSLFFSDIVGFTTMSSTMEASKVSKMLNTLLKKIDKLAHYYGVQKIDVIGDAYVAATNFMEDQARDHAARLARFAIDVMKAARETSVDEDKPAAQGNVQLRIGLHCGPVSGSVIGWQNFKYTLMGDTVNTASRMESSSAAGRIQCSEVMAAIIGQQAHEMLLKPRGGGVNIKGKGFMQTYWLSSLREGLQNVGSSQDVASIVPSSLKDRRARWLSQRAHAESSSNVLGAGAWVARSPDRPAAVAVVAAVAAMEAENEKDHGEKWCGPGRRA